MEQLDYKRLYEETLDYQIRHAVVHSGWKKENLEKNRWWTETIADIVISNNACYDEEFTAEFVDAFLNYRREIWKQKGSYL